MDQALYQNHLGILREELLVALGCTEPIAIAYAGAKARQLLGVMPEHCRVRCSGNIIKNVKGVIVPNSGGMRGIDVAATLGIVGGDPDRELAVLETVTPADIQTTQALVKEGFCTASWWRTWTTCISWWSWRAADTPPRSRSRSTTTTSPT